MDVFDVVISNKALKSLRKVPKPILDKFQLWVEAIEIDGIREVRKLPGFHDEPLRGTRKRQRSVRLNKAYRAIYEINKNKVEFIKVIEVTNHEY
jgi:toxin HigB-1